MIGLTVVEVTSMAQENVGAELVDQFTKVPARMTEVEVLKLSAQMEPGT